MSITTSKYLIVAYDIEKNRTRTKISELLLYYGLIRIQYSVFAGEVQSSKMDKLSSALFSISIADDDKIIMFPICENCRNNINTTDELPKKLKHLSI